MLFLTFCVVIFNTLSQEKRNSALSQSGTFGMFNMQHFSLVLLLLQLLKLKEHPNWIGMMHLLLESSTATSYCIVYWKLCDIAKFALCHLHYCQLCSALPCIWLLLVSASFTLTSDCIKHHWSILLLCTMHSQSKVTIHEIKHLNGPCPNFYTLGTITSHHPTSHLEVWLHVLSLPTWIEISPIGGLFLSGWFYPISSLLLQLWFLHNLLRLLLRLHVER